MKIVIVALVSALALAGAATAATASFAAREDAAAASHCASLAKDPVGCAVWAVQCVGYALGGNGCVGVESQVAPPDVQKIVECAKGQVLQILAGVTPMPCTITSAQADGPREIIDCVGYFAQQTISGRPYEPCAVGLAAVASGPDAGKVVQCTVSAAKQILAGVTPMPCDVSVAVAGPDPEGTVRCVVGAAVGAVQGRPWLCDV